ncbi:hypothetical protein G4G27_14705 [Sphingomonas sp. So64.6b]|uniref:hypothetical protein n=1 Tax=Sphingomonas sp. So64.6b TaxID=2997354 RepID=UPI001603EB5E|nr:hypothetical protein [Sphingomonas sp. So64.6b]QNA85106.1 hypothetical protein G4G27_14705 [Sphingomonas sp. So64.6b]
MELVAYAVFILMLAAPFMLAAGLLGLLLFGFRRIASGIRREQRIDVLGTAIVAAGLLAGTISYQWLRGPDAELATLQPLVVDQQLAARLPQTWVVDYAAAFAALDLLPRKYASRVLNARITDSGLLASIPEQERDAFMEEVKLVDSPSCNALIASGIRDASRRLECVTHSAVSEADVVASGPYLTVRSNTTNDAQIMNFALAAGGSIRPIARCVGRAPKEANPLLALIRGDRSLDVASSMYKCKMRAAAGALARVIATGAVG